MAQASLFFAAVCIVLRSSDANPLFTTGNIIPSQNLCFDVSNCGPCPTLDPIRTMAPVFLQPFDSPVIPIPAPAPPPPVVIQNKCMCQKTVLKPQLYQRLIQTQTNQRFLKKTYNPVVEKIEYKAKPRC